MAERIKTSEQLQKQNSFPKGCSNIEDRGSELEENEISCNNNEIVKNEEIPESSDNGSEKNSNLRKRRRDSTVSSSEIENENLQDNKIEIAVDGTRWERIPGIRAKRSSLQNNFKDISGPTEKAKGNIVKGKVSSAFSLLIDERNILKEIISCTKLEAFRVLGKEWTLTEKKFKAFIAILFAKKACETDKLTQAYLWDKEWGPSFFCKTMSEQDFDEILSIICSDKTNGEKQNLENAVLEVWNAFFENSQDCYEPGENIIVDGKFSASKPKCRSTKNSTPKLDKLGIKFLLASDVETKYVLNGFLYPGRNKRQHKSKTLSDNVVLKLIERYTEKGRCVTTDDSFTSLPLVRKLLYKKTMLVGTTRCNPKEFPKICTTQEDTMTRNSALFYRSNDITLTIYKNEENKKVCILSSKQKSTKNDRKEPEMVKLYNQNESAIKCSNELAKKYSVKFESIRWPLEVFYYILDLAAINAHILYEKTTGERISRGDFMFKLASELASENVESNMESQEANVPSTSISSSGVK